MTASSASASAPSPVPLAIARSMLSLGIEASLAFCMASASAATGAALKARQDVEVLGVEREPAYAQEAATRLDRVITADVEQLDPATLGRFDALIAADVLEHLVDPWTALRRCAQTLEPGG